MIVYLLWRFDPREPNDRRVELVAIYASHAAAIAEKKRLKEWRGFSAYRGDYYVESKEVKW